MATHVLIDGRQVSQRSVKATLAFAAGLFSALLAAVIVFVFLPLAGMAITLSAGFVAIFLIAAVFGVSIFILGAPVVAWCFGPAVMHVENSH